MARLKDPNYKRQGRRNGQMIFLPRDIGKGMVVQADKTVYRIDGAGWRKVGTLSTITGTVI
jgi:hypothetical protein